MATKQGQISKVSARQVLDSRGNPTVEAEVWTRSGLVGRAAVPSGASTGRNEAVELRDRDKGNFGGMSVMNAVTNVVKVLGPTIVGVDCSAQADIDRWMISMDGTKDKGKLGANAILAVSMASARAAAAVSHKPLYSHLLSKRRYRLPVPMMNVINGGKHAGNELAIQEFLIEPVGAKSLGEAVRFGAEVYHSLRSILRERYGPSSTNVGDEGGYAPPFRESRQALDVIVDAISAAGFTSSQVKLGIDPAASTFFDEGKSKYRIDGKGYSGEELADYYVDLANSYPLLTLEDPFHEEAYSDFRGITERLKGKVVVIGDDLYCTSPERIKRGIAEKATDGVLVKLNQIGTVTETMEAIRVSQDARLATVVSHRSGETDDTFIAHLATAVESEFIKTGAPARGERVSKYNELLRIEEELGKSASFDGDVLHGRGSHP